MKYDGIIFDLDGTLWDSTKEVYLSWLTVLKQQPDLTHIPTKDELPAVMGLSSDKLMATLFPYLSYERGQQLFQLCSEEETKYLRQHGAILYDGIEPLIKQLADGYSLSIVSNCNTGYIEAFLHAHHLADYFHDHECFGHTRKPKSENISAVIQRNSLTAPLYVGDTLWDYEAASAAGIPFVFAAYGFGNPNELPDVPFIQKPSDLLSLL